MVKGCDKNTKYEADRRAWFNLYNLTVLALR